MERGPLSLMMTGELIENKEAAPVYKIENNYRGDPFL
jgi:hypothetical protein